ncbi:ser/Thr protein phosphatase family protein [Periconia macrospinosa]|uniref:Ser/Thr protein phosphatase family protein n=1 Tax=Periconia macrospinosa TaxID=97972 RepID=A0A2V1E1N7_9PLEO|nr:ser/Thr protein phosphatase family protein [Periconia macrospinosa]
MDATIATRFLVLSDTHGEELIHTSTSRVDVAIHCGDMTEESKLDEYRTAVKMLKGIDAPLKLIIAGNHDFSLDEKVFQTHLSETRDRINDDQLLKNTFGNVGDAKAILEADDAKQAGIIFLDEGVHHFDLDNGAHLTVYASPYTSSKSTGWGFQYNPDQEHEWNISQGVDLVMTHSPPRGILDYTTSRSRAGIQTLFEEIARVKPKVHCFGHIHEAWGAKLVTWREKLSEPPSHFTDIDNDNSRLIESRAKLWKGKLDTQDVIDSKAKRLREYQQRGYRELDDVEIRQSHQTLFLNAAIEGLEEGQQQLPWVLNIQLPQQRSSTGENKKRRRSSSEGAEATRAKTQCTSGDKVN